MRGPFARRAPLLLLALSLVLSGCVMFRCDARGCLQYICRPGEGCSVENVPVRDCTPDGPAGPFEVERGRCVSVPNVCEEDTPLFRPDDILELPGRPPGLRIETDDAMPRERLMCADPDAPLGPMIVDFRYVPIVESLTPVPELEIQEGVGQLAVTVVEVGQGSGPDLVVTQLQGPAIASTGELVTVDFTVANTGTEPTGFPAFVELFLSTDAALDAADTSLGVSPVAALPPGGVASGRFITRIPESAVPGPGFLVARADALDLVVERNETNNTRAVAITLVRTDLAISVLSGPATAAAGQAVTLQDTTANQGDTAAAASTTAFYLSTDAFIGFSDPVLGSRAVPALPGGLSSAGSTVVTIPPATAPGDYLIVARADDGGVVPETQENNNTATWPITIGPPAPPAVSASATPATVAQGQAAQLSAVVGGGVPPFAFAWSPAAGLSDATIADPVVTPVETTTYTVRVTDAAGGEATAQVTVTVLPPSADLALTKSGSPGVVGAGDLLTYTLTVANEGPSPATGVTLTDTLPAAVDLVSASSGCSGAATVVTCTLGALASGANRTVSLVVTPRLPADLAVTRLEVSPSDPVVVGDHLTYTIEVANFGPEAATGVRLGTLAGGFDASGAASGPPLDVALVSATASPVGTCTLLGTGGAGPLDCDLGTLAPGARSTVTVVVTPTTATTAVGTPPGALVNAARVTTPGTPRDPDSTNDETTVASVVLPASGADLAVTRFEVAPATPVVAGDTLTYTIEVANFGPDAVPDVLLTTLARGFDPATGAPDPSPLDVTLLSASVSPAGTCTDLGGGSGPVQCLLETMASGARATVTVVAETRTPTTAVGAPGALVNRARVMPAAGGGSDPDGRNDEGAAATVVLPKTGGDLAVTRLDVSPATPILAGGTLSYTIEVANFGADPVAGARLTTLGGGFDGAGWLQGPPLDVIVQSAATSTGGACLDAGGAGAGPVQCELGTLAGGARATVTVVVTVPQATTDVGVPGALLNAARAHTATGALEANPGNDERFVTSTVLPLAPTSLVNTASVSSAVADPDLADNTDTATTALGLSLSVTASATPSVIAPGQSAQLMATAAGGVPPARFAWAPAGGLSDAAIASPVATPAATTTYTVTVTDGVGTSASADVTVTVQGAALPVVSLAVTDGAAAETGTDPGTLTVSRTGPTDAPLVVAYTVAGTATAGLDYQSLAGTATLPAGAASVTLAITPLDDALLEGSESVVLTLTPAPTYALDEASSGVVVIADDERPVVLITAMDPAAAEAGLDPGAFTVSRTGPTTTPLVVDYIVAGTAQGGADYEAIAGSVTIPAGSASVTIPVTPLDDTLVEGAETVALLLSPSPAYERADAPAAIVVIADDEVATVSLVPTDPDAAEAGPNPGVFTVTRSGPTATALVVGYTVGGTATGGVDYDALAGTVTIPAGAPSATIAVTPIDDTLIEGPESVVLTLDPGSGYVVGTPGSATVTIDDDESVVTVAATDGAATEPEDGAPVDTGAFAITRTGGTAGALTVRYTLGGSAVNGVDYQGVSSVATIPAGQASITVPVTPRADALVEGAETATLTLNPDTAYVVGTPGTAAVTIADNAAVVTVVATDPTASEAPLNTGSFTITRANNLGVALTVRYTLGGTATNGVDYDGISTVLTLPAGQTSATVTVTPRADVQSEPPETVLLTLSPDPAYVVGAPDTATVTILPDS